MLPSSTLSLSTVHCSFSFLPTVHFPMSRYPAVCLYFIPCISRCSIQLSSQTRPVGTITANTCPIQRRNHMTTRTTPKIHSHIPKIPATSPFNGIPTTRPRIPTKVSTRGPRSLHCVIRAMSLPNLHETHAITSHPPHPSHILSTPHRHRLPFSSSTLLSRLALLIALPTSMPIPHLL